MYVKTQTQEADHLPFPEHQEHAATPRVVIVGAGFGGLQAARALKKYPRTVRIVDQNNVHLFQPTLYQVASAGLAPWDIALPVREVLRTQRNASVLMARVTGVDVEQQCALLESHRAIHYDFLILATGACWNYAGPQEWSRLAPGMKTLADAIAVRRLVLSAIEAAELEYHALQGNFRHIQPACARIVLIGGGPQILKGFPVSLARPSEQKLKQLGVEVITGFHVEELNERGVRTKDEFIATENVIWTAGNCPQTEVDHKRWVKEEPDLAVPGDGRVFVIGDTALAIEQGRPLPGLAPVAIQEGCYVAATGYAGNTSHYRAKGALATVGRSFGVVAIDPVRFCGCLAWWTWLFVHILYLLAYRRPPADISPVHLVVYHLAAERTCYSACGPGTRAHRAREQRRR